MGKYRKAVFIVAYSFHNGKLQYLVLKRKLHWKGWEFPKGKIEPGEKKIDTVRRELNEESGHRALKIKKFNIKGKYKYKKLLKDRPEFMGQSYVLYAADVKRGKVKLDRIEHSSYKWADFKTALKMLTWANQKKCLRIVNSWLKKK